MSEAIATTATNIVTAVPKNRTFKDLNDVISRSECYCLNENPNFPHGNLFMGDNTLVLKSDADEQLILHIEFQDAVKLYSINLTAPSGETAPKVIKLFANRTNLGFSDANDVEPTQILDLTQEDLQGHKDIELRFVKFQRVKSITLFVEENYGEEETHIGNLHFYGERLAGTNMNELKKVEGHEE